LEAQGKMLSNTHEIKRQYLEELKEAKNPHHVTPEQYLSTTTTPPSASQSKPSGMFQSTK
jgi:hypothetical protein